MTATKPQHATILIVDDLKANVVSVRRTALLTLNLRSASGTRAAAGSAWGPQGRVLCPNRTSHLHTLAIGNCPLRMPLFGADDGTWNSVVIGLAYVPPAVVVPTVIAAHSGSPEVAHGESAVERHHVGCVARGAPEFRPRVKSKLGSAVARQRKFSMISWRRSQEIDFDRNTALYRLVRPTYRNPISPSASGQNSGARGPIADGARVGGAAGGVGAPYIWAIGISHTAFHQRPPGVESICYERRLVNNSRLCRVRGDWWLRC